MRPNPAPHYLPEVLAHHAAGRPRLGVARAAGGINVEAVVIAVYAPGDRTSREDIDESSNMSITCDVIVVEPRLKTVLRDVPVLRQSAGYNDHESWLPQAATKVVSSGATLVFDGDGLSNVDPMDTDGDRVVVGFLGNDLNRPVIIGQLDNRNTTHRPDDGYRWRRYVGGALVAVTADGQIELDASASDAGAVVVKGKDGTVVTFDDAGVTVDLGASGKVVIGAGGEKLLLGSTFIADLNTWLTGLTTCVAAAGSATTAVQVAAAFTTFATPHGVFAGKVSASASAGAPHLSAKAETE